MQTKKNEIFCSVHKIDEKFGRIKCPLDPNHSIFEKDLEKHLKVCNGNKLLEIKKQNYFKEDFNKLNQKETTENISIENWLKQTNEDDFKKFCQKINEFYQNNELEISKMIFKNENKKQSRMEIQQESIIGNMKNENLMNPDLSYLEFGCGKAKLSFAILENLFKNFEFMDEQKIGNFILIDRDNFRKKDDCKIIGECKKKKLDTEILRLQMDISNLDLNGIDILKKENCVCVSKHLCGEATDLTIRCIEKSKEYCKFNGIFIALCCHHKCNWNSYLNQEYFLKNNFSGDDFNFMTKMASWGVSGFRTKEKTYHLSPDQK
eukprot:gene8759-707_t